MRKVFLKGPRISHLLNIDDNVESRAILRYVWIWRLKVKKVSALCQFLSRATAESEVSLDTLGKIIVGNIWKITLPQA